jgi:hypothetical protein
VLETLHALAQLPEQRADAHARDVSPEAEVLAGAEAEVAVRPPRDVEAERIREHFAVEGQR